MPVDAKVVALIVALYDDGTRAELRTGNRTGAAGGDSPAAWRAFEADAYYNATCCASAYPKDPLQPHVNINAALEPVGWTLAGFNASSWPPAAAVSGFAAPLVPKPTPPVRASPGIAPASVTHVAPGRWFIDFGVERQATVTVTVNVSAPAAPDASPIALAVQLGEQQYPPGTVPGVAYPTVRWHMTTGNTYRDVWTLRPGVQTLSQVEYSEFRYGEVVVVSGNASRIVGRPAVSATMIAYDADYDAASFTSPLSTLNDVYRLCQWTAVATAVDMFTDSNTRQRDVECIESIRLSSLVQWATSLEFALPRYTMAYALNERPIQLGWWEWHPIAVIWTWQDWYVTGNLESVTSRSAGYEQLRNFTMMTLLNTAGLADCRIVPPSSPYSYACAHAEVDWPMDMRDGFVMTPVNTVVNAYTYRALECFADIATALGHAEDATVASAAASKLRAAMHEVMYDDTAAATAAAADATATGPWRDGPLALTDHRSFHASVFVAGMGVPADAATVATTWEYVRRRALGDAAAGLPSNVLPAAAALDVLFGGNATDQGWAGVALLVSNGTNSWRGMLRQNATATMEAWTPDEKPNLTFSHGWAASPAYAVARWLCGVEATEPGYASVAITPRPGWLATGACVVPTVRGPVAVNFTQTLQRGRPGASQQATLGQGDTLPLTLLADHALAFSFTARVGVPGNVAAMVWLPASACSGKTVFVDGGARQGTLSADGATVGVAVSAGTHVVSSDA